MGNESRFVAYDPQNVRHFTDNNRQVSSSNPINQIGFDLCATRKNVKSL